MKIGGIVRQPRVTKIFWRLLLLLLVLASPWIGYNGITPSISAETIISADWQSGDATYSARLVEGHGYHLNVDARSTSPRSISILISEVETAQVLFQRSYMLDSSLIKTHPTYAVDWFYKGDKDFVCSKTAVYDIAISTSIAERSYSFGLLDFVQGRPTGWMYVVSLWWFTLMCFAPWLIWGQMRKMSRYWTKWDKTMVILLFVEGLAGFILSLVLPSA